MAYEEFAAGEKAGWSQEAKADAYVNLFAPVSDQLIPAVLEATGADKDSEVLDLCCGHGNAAEALVKTGARVIGLDFSPAMLVRARQRVPEASFVEGDAANLPFGEESFDAVVCNVGIGHMPDSDAVLREISRVLRPGGIAALTSWREPEHSASFQIFFGALKAHGDPSVAPPAPDFHLFSRRSEASDALSSAGFKDVRFVDIDSAFHFEEPSEFADVFENATVRAAMVIESQTREARSAIREALTERVANGFSDGAGGWRVPFPATLAVARI